MSEAERWIWQILRSHQMQGYKFRRQEPIGRYIADFVCHEARLIVEIDGGQQDGTTRSWQISTASIRRSLTSCAASAPPKPSPIKAHQGGFCR
jgi:very-short-patch-repair endonuclease